MVNNSNRIERRNYLLAGILSIILGRFPTREPPSDPNRRPFYQRGLSLIRSTNDEEIEGQAYQTEDRPNKEIHIETIEKMAEELAHLQTMIEKVPGIKRNSLSRFKRTNNEKRSVKFLKNAAIIAILGASLGRISESLVDTETVKEILQAIVINHPVESLFIGGGLLVEIGKLIRDPDKIRQEQVRTLAHKLITQHLMDQKILDLTKQGRLLYSLDEQQAKRIEIALGGEEKSKNPIVLLYRWATKRKRYGHLYLPGIFNSVLNIDYIVRRFYENLGLTSFSQRAAQTEFDREMEDYLKEHTYHGSLSELLVDEQIHSIPEVKLKRLQQMNRKRAKLIALETTKPSEEQTYQIPLEEVLPNTNNKKQPIKGILKVLNLSASEEQSTASPNPTDKVDPEILKMRQERAERRAQKGQNSNYSAGSVASFLVKAVLPNPQDGPDTTFTSQLQHVR